MNRILTGIFGMFLFVGLAVAEPPQGKGNNKEQKPEPMQVYSNGISIGRLVDFTDGNSGLVLIQSDTGYLFVSAIAGGEHLTKVTLYYSGTGCSGTLYVPQGGASGVPEWAGRTSGYVVRVQISGPGPSDAYYVPRESTSAQVQVESYFRNGVCQDESALQFGFEAFPNDEAITGVPGIKPSLELYIGMP